MNFKDQILDIVYTSYNGSKTAKEEKLISTFNYHNKPYSQDIVKDIVFNKYVGMGGYKDRETFTNWIFETN